jgi:hypothetical protein
MSKQSTHFAATRVGHAEHRQLPLKGTDAVTIPRLSGLVLNAHKMIQQTSAVLPMPWPDATAI